MNFFVKLSGDLPTMQKAFFRNLVAATVAFVLLIRRPSQFGTIKGNVYPLVMRSLAGTLGIILNFSAIDGSAAVPSMLRVLMMSTPSLLACSNISSSLCS